MTVERVSFYGAHHLLIVHAVVVPIHYDAIGFSQRWPPSRDTLTQPGVQWDKRVAAIGARVPPFRGRSLDLAARLGLPSAHIRAAPLHCLTHFLAKDHRARA